jgi:hypothetical protein
MNNKLALDFDYLNMNCDVTCFSLVGDEEIDISCDKTISFEFA